MKKTEKDSDAQLRLLLAGFRKGIGYGALGGLLIYAAVLLGMSPAKAGSLFGVAAGMVTAVLGGAAIGGFAGAYIMLVKHGED